MSDDLAGVNTGIDYTRLYVNPTIGYVGPSRTVCPTCGHCPTCGQHRPTLQPPWPVTNGTSGWGLPTSMPTMPTPPLYGNTTSGLG